MAELSEKEISEIQARVDAATPGPWFDIEHEEWKGADHKISTKENGDWDSFANIATAARNDAPFIAHARTDLPRLLAAYIERGVEKFNLEIRCKQYDAIVRGVCLDLGISEDAGCDEIAIASAKREARVASLREALDRVARIYHQGSAASPSNSFEDCKSELCVYARTILAESEGK